MSQFLEKKELFDGILQLNENEVQDPMKVIEQFFNDYRLHECRDMLRAMVETCLTTDNTEFSEASERGDLLLRQKDLERLFEANKLLLRQRKPVDPSAEDKHPGNISPGQISPGKISSPESKSDLF